MSEDTDSERARGAEPEGTSDGRDGEPDEPDDVQDVADLDADGPVPDESDSPFEAQEYEDVDADTVLEGEEGEPGSAPPVGTTDERESAADVERDDDVEDAEERAVDVIESRVCQGCPYFGDPPELHCTHEGTEIREVLDTDHYVVVDCPVVADDVEF